MEIAIIQRDGPLAGLSLLNERDGCVYKEFCFTRCPVGISNKRADRTDHPGVKNVSFIA